MELIIITWEKMKQLQHLFRFYFYSNAIFHNICSIYFYVLTIECPWINRRCIANKQENRPIPNLINHCRISMMHPHHSSFKPFFYSAWSAKYLSTNFDTFNYMIFISSNTAKMIVHTTDIYYNLDRKIEWSVNSTCLLNGE